MNDKREEVRMQFSQTGSIVGGRMMWAGHVVLIDESRQPERSEAMKLQGCRKMGSPQMIRGCIDGVFEKPRRVFYWIHDSKPNFVHKLVSWMNTCNEAGTTSPPARGPVSIERPSWDWSSSSSTSLDRLHLSWQRSVRRNVSTDSVFELDIASYRSLVFSDDVKSSMRPGDGIVVDKDGRVVGTVTVHAPSGRARDDTVTVNEEGDHWGLVRLFHEEVSCCARGKTDWDCEGGDDWDLGGMFNDTEYEAMNASGDSGGLV
ncbi:hypothetical protein LSAT2_030894 [Lamellibrachia satsuma]|nr:hypothetical protein LSAT2_030894 [Lamellibrachia satsuma]